MLVNTRKHANPRQPGYLIVLHTGARAQHLIKSVTWLQGRYASRSRGPTGDELIVVTVLVATDGKLDVPNINSQQSLRTTLNRLGSLRSDQVLIL